MDNLVPLFFYIISTVLLLSAIATVFAKKIVNAALYACISFLAIAGVFFMLNATFNAVVQIAVYVVAVTLLIVFGIMLTSQDDEKKSSVAFSYRTIISLGALGVIFLGLTWALLDNYMERILDIVSGGLVLNESLDSLYVIGEKLMTDYVLSFELVSILLLVLIVGIGLVCVVRKGGENQ